MSVLQLPSHKRRYGLLCTGILSLYSFRRFEFVLGSLWKFVVRSGYLQSHLRVCCWHSESFSRFVCIIRLLLVGLHPMLIFSYYFKFCSWRIHRCRDRQLLSRRCDFTRLRSSRLWLQGRRHPHLGSSGNLVSPFSPTFVQEKHKYDVVPALSSVTPRQLPFPSFKLHGHGTQEVLSLAWSCNGRFVSA